jgi:O-antigen/teichoic acid export membrane protein
MIDEIKRLGKDELVKGSFILFIMINIFNLLNYLFQFFMARLLGPSDYGILAVLSSLIYIFAIPSEAIQTIMTKYTSDLNLNREYGKIKDLFYRTLKKTLKMSSVIFLLLIPIAFILSNFLKINLSLLLLTNFFIFCVFILPITRGILQGTRKFFKLGLTMAIEALTKVILAVSLVFLGWKVYGAIGAALISVLIGFIVTIFFVKGILTSKRERTNIQGIYSYSFPVFVTISTIILMYSLDIILAKRFFAPDIAGKYAVISMLGKIIYFGTFAIGKTMFPMSNENHENGKNTSRILIKSIKMVSVLSAAILLIYLLFPKFIISTLFGAVYTDVSSILFIIGLTFTFISLSNILILYSLSINKIKRSCFSLLFFVLLQIVLLNIFHSSLLEYSLAFLAVSFLMFVYSLFLVKR